MSENRYIDVSNSRTADQRKVMETIATDGVCPFCSDHLLKYHKEPIFKEGRHWLLTRNQWPYDHTKHHLLAIAKEHIETIKELRGEQMTDLLELFQWAQQEFNIEGGAIAMRVGKSDKYKNSVKHLHIHFIEPNVDDPNHPGVKFSISKAKKSSSF